MPQRLELPRILLEEDLLNSLSELAILQAGRKWQETSANPLVVHFSPQWIFKKHILTVFLYPLFAATF
jgi:hypothetical protein